MALNLLKKDKGLKAGIAANVKKLNGVMPCSRFLVMAEVLREFRAKYLYRKKLS